MEVDRENYQNLLVSGVYGPHVSLDAQHQSGPLYRLDYNMSSKRNLGMEVKLDVRPFTKVHEGKGLYSAKNGPPSVGAVEGPRSVWKVARSVLRALKPHSGWLTDAHIYGWLVYDNIGHIWQSESSRQESSVNILMQAYVRHL